jgi:hypothetical protein
MALPVADPLMGPATGEMQRQLPEKELFAGPARDILPELSSFNYSPAE